MTGVKRIEIGGDYLTKGKEWVPASDYDALAERFEACFKQKEHAEHGWGMANARIRELEAQVAELEYRLRGAGIAVPTAKG